MRKEMGYGKHLEEWGPGGSRTLRMHFLKKVEFVCNTDRTVTQEEGKQKFCKSALRDRHSTHTIMAAVSALLPTVSAILGKSLDSSSSSFPSSKLGRDNSICLIASKLCQMCSARHTAKIQHDYYGGEHREIEE